MTPVATDELVRKWAHDGQTPNLLGVMADAETELAFYSPLLRTRERLADLEDLAEWSATSAELDWGHAEDVDRRGWGLHTD